jgi:uncharacterized protein (TIGR00106 family)
MVLKCKHKLNSTAVFKLYEGKIMILLEFSMSPMDKGESVSPYVSRSLDIISNSGVPYRLGPMGTCLEGEWDEVMGVIKQCLDKMSSDCDRITCSIKIDYRKGKSGRLESKMASVEAKLGKKLNT